MSESLGSACLHWATGVRYRASVFSRVTGLGFRPTSPALYPLSQFPSLFWPCAKLNNNPTKVFSKDWFCCSAYVRCPQGPENSVGSAKAGVVERVSWRVSAGNQTWVSARIIHTLSQLAISLAPVVAFETGSHVSSDMMCI